MEIETTTRRRLTTDAEIAEFTRIGFVLEDKCYVPETTEVTPALVECVMRSLNDPAFKLVSPPSTPIVDDIEAREAARQAEFEKTVSKIKHKHRRKKYIKECKEFDKNDKEENDKDYYGNEYSFSEFTTMGTTEPKKPNGRHGNQFFVSSHYLHKPQYEGKGLCPAYEMLKANTVLGQEITRAELLKMFGTVPGSDRRKFKDYINELVNLGVLWSVKGNPNYPPHNRNIKPVDE
jgi:hypothetical protein